jgi:hypothetical protein
MKEKSLIQKFKRIYYWYEVLEGDDTSLEGRGLIVIYIVKRWIQNDYYAYIFNGATQHSGEVL